VTALDINEWRLGLAKSAFGASHIVNASGDCLKTLQELTGGDFYHTVIDATGNKTAMEKGPSYMGHGGKYILVGLYKSNLEFSHPALHAKETSLLCSRNATREDFQKVIDILSEKKFPVSDYITHQVPFGEMTENFQSWTDPANQTIKAMIVL
jgi:threonine dehydrogenase-like Zn-dependent dehydrogenase